MLLTIILIGLVLILLLMNLLLVEWPSLRALYMAHKIHGPPVIPIIGGIHILLTAAPTG